MSLNLKLYSDALCTKELELSGALYELLMGATTGIDCRETDIYVAKDIWVKNVGTVPVMYANIVKEGDDKDRISFSAGSTVVLDSLPLGNIPVGDVKQFQIKLGIPKGTASGLYNSSVFIRYKAVP